VGRGRGGGAAQTSTILKGEKCSHLHLKTILLINARLKSGKKAKTKIQKTLGKEGGDAPYPIGGAATR